MPSIHPCLPESEAVLYRPPFFSLALARPCDWSPPGAVVPKPELATQKANHISPPLSLVRCCCQPREASRSNQDVVVVFYFTFPPASFRLLAQILFSSQMSSALTNDAAPAKKPRTRRPRSHRGCTSCKYQHPRFALLMLRLGPQSGNAPKVALHTALCNPFRLKFRMLTRIV